MKLINEAIRTKDFNSAQALITKYLRSKLGNKVYAYPAPEVWKPLGGTTMVGIRFFIMDGGAKSLRLNWKTVGQIGSKGLVQISYWDGSKNPQPHPSHNIKLDHETSLVKVLPMVVDLIHGGLEKSGFYISESVTLQNIPMITDFAAVSELNEASYSAGEISKTAHNVINALKQGVSPGDQYKAGGQKHYGPGWGKVNDVIKNMYPNMFSKQGIKVLIDKDIASKIDATKVIAALGGDPDVVSYSVSAGQKEEVEVQGASEEDIERLTYEEQLDSLKTGMKLLMANATNQIYLAGRGGIGKTQTVEDELAAAGKSDGDGYTKITGSASTAGIYRLMFQNRKEIMLFDDSDGALADQDSRNLFKAASDTKKVRKISWQKAGKMYIDPDDYDWDNEGDQEELPRSFDFTGKIIFISNLPLNKLDPDGALRTRGFVINIDPFDYELVAFMKKIAPKMPLDVDYKLTDKDREEVVDVIAKRTTDTSKIINIRMLVRGLNVRAGVEKSGGSVDEWKKFVLRFC